jgi:hypothetical protein
VAQSHYDGGVFLIAKGHWLLPQFAVYEFPLNTIVWQREELL